MPKPPTLFSDRNNDRFDCWMTLTTKTYHPSTLAPTAPLITPSKDWCRGLELYFAIEKTSSIARPTTKTYQLCLCEDLEQWDEVVAISQVFEQIIHLPFKLKQGERENKFNCLLHISLVFCICRGLLSVQLNSGKWRRIKK